MREIRADDLELYAINTGAFYSWHCNAINEPDNVWYQHVAVTVQDRYRKEIEPARASVRTLQTVAANLKAYYQRHVSEK